MCAGVFSMNAFAEDGMVDDNSSSDVIYEEPTDPPYEEETEPDYTEPDYTEPVYEEPTDYVDDNSSDGYDDNSSSDGEDYTDYVDDNSDTDSSSDDDYIDYTEYTYEEPTDYYFDPADDDIDDGASYEDHPSSQVELYKSDSNIDTNTLNDDDWSKIVLSLQSASGSDDGDDFSAIQNNTVKGDTGHWYLYVGIILVVVSVAGFAYSFISWQKQRKAYAMAGGAKGKKPDDATAGANGRSSARYSSARRDKSDYGDSYSSSPRKRSDRQDTAKINLPKDSDSSPRGRHFK